jgi:monoamine oxidase
MDRRNFLKASGLLTTASMLPKAPEIQAAARYRSGEKVLILGAGLAGLSAALYLRQRNIPFTILEARNRIGGRVFTHRIDDTENLHVELGAEWVGESHERMKTLCRELGLNLLNHQFETHLTLDDEYYPANQWNYENTWLEKYGKILTDFKQLQPKKSRQLDQVDWWRYLLNHGISERDLEIKELLDSTDFGETIRNVSAYSGLSEYAESSPKNEMDYRIEGGNTRLIEAMAQKAGTEHIVVNKKVTQVRQNGPQVSVTCSDGSRYEANHLICTLPVLSLLQIAWEPVLPAEKADALQQLQYCRIIKSAVVFKERFWQDEAFDMVTDSMAHYFFHSSKNLPATKGTLTSYAIGDKAYILSKMKPEQRMKEICSALKPAFGNVEPYAEKVVSYYWGGDPFSKGAYAIYDTHQWFGIREIIAKPFRRILFAGEHLGEWQGFMEGSVQTGEDAARAIVS